ncbi:MAG: translocation/assembly module TamB domain-containing protein [Acidobacteriota bacterium]
MRIVRRLVYALVLVLTLIVGAAAAAIIVSQTVWFKDWLRGYIVREAHQYLNGNLSIERLGGNLFFGLEMENIGLSMDGSQVVAVKDLSLDYNIFQLISKGLSVDSIRLNQPVLYLRREGDAWSISRLIKQPAGEADRSGPGSPMAVDSIGITNGSVVIEGPVGVPGIEVPKRFDHLDARLKFNYEPVRYSIEITQVSFRGSDPELGLNALSGGLAVKEDTLFVDKLALRTEQTSLAIDGAVQHYLTMPVFNLRVSSDKLSLPEIARIVPALDGIRVEPAFEIHVNGPTDRLGIDMNVRSSAGALTGSLVADVSAPGQSVTGDVTVRHLDLAPLLKSPAQKSDVTGTVRLDLQAETLSDLNSLRGSLHVDAPRVVAAGLTVEQIKGDAHIEGRRVDLDGRASAFGATATAAGRVTLPEGREPLSYVLHGQARRINLRQMPRDLNLPSAATDVNGDYRVSGRNDAGGPHLKGDVTLLDSAVPGAHIGAGSTAAFSVDGKQIGYAADATVSDLDLQKVGQAFAVTALTEDRYRSSINGHIAAKGQGTTPATIELTASGTLTDSSMLGGRIPQLTFDAALADNALHVKANGELRGFDPAAISDKPALKGVVGGTIAVDATWPDISNISPATMAVTANGTLTDSSIMGGRIPQLTFDAALADNALRLKAQGELHGFDPAALSDKPALKGEVGGKVDVDATVTNLSDGVTPDNVQATGRIDLQPSTVGGLRIDSAVLDGDYRDATGVIRRLEVKGRQVNLTATGTVAINETGQSNLMVHADATNLDEIGRLIDKPLRGTAMVDATVTGNRRELQAAGHLMANDVAYGETGALAMSTDFAVKVPDLAFDRATGEADTAATFVTIGGQNINDLQAKTQYDNKQLVFEATARQPQRSLGVGGSLTLHPDHQEVHLEQLTLQADSLNWQLAPGSDATVQYAGSAVTVDGLQLVSGDQQIAANGKFGQPGDALSVTLNNVDLAAVDALLLRPPQFTGRLNASSTITGSTDAPEVKAEFHVNEGGFRQFRYDMLSGTVDYAGKGITLDTRLQQNPTTWATAKGYVPTALFNGTAAFSHDLSPDPADRVDLHIDSSAIDIGVVQGFTTQLTDVTGVLQARIDVTGTAGDPHPTGAVTIQNAAFTVASTGVGYTKLDGRIDLQSDRIHTDGITVLDNHGQSLSISGDLAVHELQVGGVNIAIKATDFKVIDNAMGNIRLNAALNIAGELAAARIDGDIGVTTGMINVDPILAALGDSAYSIKATDIGTEAAPATSAAPKPSMFDTMQLDVHVTVPNDLVVRGQNLQPSGAVIGLGTVNLTVGGDVWADKAPYDQLRLTGAINTVRGTYDFQGRRFDILRDGTVRFDGLDQLDPTLDIKTQRVIQAVTANVNIRGRLSRPEIVLSSTPPLEEADIMALIVFNQPLNQLGEGEQISLAQRAQALATGALVGQLSRSIGTLLNVDLFEISAAPENGDAAQLTIGQQLGQNLYVKLQQGVGDQNQTNFILEYELTRWLRLRTNVVQGSGSQQQMFQRAQGTGADLLFFFSY